MATAEQLVAIKGNTIASLPPTATVLEAARLMNDRHIGSVLVTCKGKLAGLFTVTDACRHFGEYLRQQFAPGGGDEAA